MSNKYRKLLPAPTFQEGNYSLTVPIFDISIAHFFTSVAYSKLAQQWKQEKAGTARSKSTQKPSH